MSPLCAFCGIAAGQRAAPIVLDEPVALAFLDHRPLFPGHCLLIPRAHYETLAELPESEVGRFFSLARLLACAVEAAMAAEGSFVAINNRVSQSVPHLHAHVVPRRRKDGLRGFFWPRQKYESEAAEAEVAGRVRAALKALRETA